MQPGGTADVSAELLSGARSVPSPVSFQHRCMGRCYLSLCLLSLPLQSALLPFHIVQDPCVGMIVKNVLL